MRYKVGVCQFNPKFLQIEENLTKLKIILTNIQADLVVLPELVTSGYLFVEPKEVESASEDAFKGPTAQTLVAIARQNNMSISAGFAEKSEGRYFNSAMLVNPDGEIKVYRKTHLFFEEKKFFSPGNTGFKVFPAKKGVKVGSMICFDWIFPESARSLALMGAEIIAHNANLVLPWCQQAMITRSLENRIFSVTSNRTGKEKNQGKILDFTGMSQIVSPKGEVIKRLNREEETVFITEIETSEAHNKRVTELNDIFSDRRPEMYLSS